jgi:molybdopterin molybdotransferase
MPSSAMPSVRVLSFEQARRVVEQHAATVSAAAVETVDLLTGLGRVLAEQIVADRDFPPFRRATRDGYAVRASDLANVPTRLQVVGEIKAGAAPESQARALGPHQAVGIMTGAPLPEGFDAVVMVEHTSAADHSAGVQTIEVSRKVESGDNFVPRGAEARAGQVLLDRGYRLDPPGIAISASVGKARVQVYSKPRVAILSTGDELVETDMSPGPAQIRNSNSYSLAAQVQNAGGEPVRLPIAPDEPMRLQALIDEGLGCDLLLLTGGVSMGKYDLVEQVLTGLQAEFYFTGVEIQPGKPAVFGSCGAGALARLLAAHEKPTGTGMPAPQKKYFFGLPGNPVSTMVTFELFAKPMLKALAGQTPQPLTFLAAKLKSEIRTKTGLKRFLPAILSGEFEKAEVELAPWQGSGDIAALAKANCYVAIPPDRERIAAGEWVSLLMR